ncbi:MAG: VCBS repeat-containing protein [Cocleimonas sp.]
MNIFLTHFTFSLLLLALPLSAQENQVIFSHISSADKTCSTPNKHLPCPTLSGTEQTASLILDINGDGKNDFVIADRSTLPSIVWFERINKGWDRHIIDNNPLEIEAGGDFYDIDGDGDLDISFGGDYSTNKIWWWENPSPHFNAPWIRRIIKNDGSNMHHDQQFGDFDGDGKTELIFWNQKEKKLFLADIPENPKTSSSWSKKSIFTASSKKFEGIAKADINEDGKLDIVAAGRWFKHNGDNTFKTNIIDDSMSFTRAAAGQLIKGGWAETVFVCGDCDGPLKMYVYKKGDWSEKILIDNVIHGHSLQLTDMNNDSNLDIFVAEMRHDGKNPEASIKILYGDGKGAFEIQEIGKGMGNHESRVADLDGDGDIDILSKPYNWETPRIDIWLNQSKSGSTTLPLNKWQRHLIGTLNNQGTHIVYGDFDNDGKTDIAAADSWFKNPGKTGNPWQKKAIGKPLHNVAIAQDFNNDGKVDLFGTEGIASKANNSLVWAENKGSEFKVHSNIEIGGTGDFLQGIDFLTASQQVILSWHNAGGGLHAVQIPTKPEIQQWPFTTLSTVTQSEDLSVGDIDNDGDEDILQGTQYLRNNGDTFDRVSIGTVSDLDADATPDRNNLVDINGDGQLDAVVALEKGSHLLWFEQKSPTQWDRHIITDDLMGQGFSMDVADFDKDGDPDIVVGEHRGNPNNRVIIFENKNKGQLWNKIVIDSGSSKEIDHHDGTQVVDIDHDDDLDIISIGWYNKKVWIFENTANP